MARQPHHRRARSHPREPLWGRGPRAHDCSWEPRKGPGPVSGRSFFVPGSCRPQTAGEGGGPAPGPLFRGV